MKPSKQEERGLSEFSSNQMLKKKGILIFVYHLNHCQYRTKNKQNKNNYNPILFLHFSFCFVGVFLGFVSNKIIPTRLAFLQERRFTLRRMNNTPPDGGRAGLLMTNEIMNKFLRLFQTALVLIICCSKS